MRLTILILLFAALLMFVGSAQAADWITAPSYFTHDPMSAERVSQYTPVGPFYYYSRPDYAKSGYRHNRSTFQFGGSADNLHIIEEWGRPVRPYEEWRFPYRPYGSPYQAWGPPYGGLGGFNGYIPPYGFYPPFGGGAGFPGGGFPGFPAGGFGPLAPGVNAQPWADGHYPSYDRNDRSQYYRSYP